jgi:hypothetical protein
MSIQLIVKVLFGLFVHFCDLLKNYLISDMANVIHASRPGHHSQINNKVFGRQIHGSSSLPLIVLKINIRRITAVTVAAMVFAVVSMSIPTVTFEE